MYLFLMSFRRYSQNSAAVGLNTAQKPTRSFLHDNKALELRLEVSDRVTHQLSTAVFAIFIREVLGYRSVTVTKRRDAFNVSAVLTRMTGCSNPLKFVLNFTSI